MGKNRSLIMKPLEKVLEYTFTNPELLDEALTHPSLAYEAQGPKCDNQRLEFLGDSVIQLVLTDLLYEMFPAFDEGRLTKLRARLVSGNALHRFAKKMNLGDSIKMGKGEETSGGRQRISTLADAFEAVMGAIYLDGGLEAARKVLVKHCSDAVARIAESPEEKNPKGELQEILQSISKDGPIYEVEDETGPDHAKEFHVRVLWKGMGLGRGVGKSKKMGEIKAASNALEMRLWEDFSI